jgi:PAS domain S-box-containing protein
MNYQNFDLLSVLFQTASDGIAVADTKTHRFILVNSMMSAMTGYTVAELLEMCVADIHPPANLDYVLEQFNEQVKQGRGLALNIPILRKDKTIFYADVNSSTVLVGDLPEEHEYLIGIFRDITERRTMELRIADSEKKLETIIDSCPDAITVTDMMGIVTECDRATLQLHGYITKAEVIGMSAFNFFTPNELDRAKTGLTRTLTEGIIHNVEYTLLRKDGSTFIASLSASVIKDAKGQPMSFVAITQDITERKEADRKLQNAFDQLRKVEQEKDELYANISHEFRTPLVAIKGFGELCLNDSELSPIQQENMQVILRNTLRLENLVNEVLDYSMLKSGRMPFKEETFSVFELTTEILREMKVIIDEKRIVFECDCPPDDVVTLDRAQISKMIRNLISNAIKYSFEKGRVNIISRINGGMWEFSIQDCGIGIAAADLPKLFARFSRLTTNVRGIGLGLSICKGIVERYEGELLVESKGVEQGSTFKFRIPLIKNE